MCSLSFSTNRGLQTHFSKIHNTSKNLTKCRYCNKEFSKSCVRSRHEKTCTENQQRNSAITHTNAITNQTINNTNSNNTNSNNSNSNNTIQNVIMNINLNHDSNADSIIEKLIPVTDSLLQNIVSKVYKKNKHVTTTERLVKGMFNEGLDKCIVVTDSGLRSITWKNEDNNNKIVKDIKGQALARRTTEVNREFMGRKYEEYQEEKKAIEIREKARFREYPDFDYDVREEYFKILQSSSVCLDGYRLNNKEFEKQFAKCLVNNSESLALHEHRIQKEKYITFANLTKFKISIFKLYIANLDLFCISSPKYIGTVLRAQSNIQEEMKENTDTPCFFIKNDDNEDIILSRELLIRTCRLAFRNAFIENCAADVCKNFIDITRSDKRKISEDPYRYVLTSFIRNLLETSSLQLQGCKDLLFSEYVQNAMKYHIHFALDAINLQSDYAQELADGFFTSLYK